MLPPGIFHIDLYEPTSDSTIDFIKVVHTHVDLLGTKYHEQRGTCLIVNRTRYLPGKSRIKKSSNTTRTVTNTGTYQIRNPLQYIPAFQKEPLNRDADRAVEFQRGKGRIRVTAVTKVQHGSTNIL